MRLHPRIPVIAANFRHFQAFCDANKLPSRNKIFTFVNDEYRIRSFRGLVIVLDESFTNNTKEARLMIEYVRAHNNFYTLFSCEDLVEMKNVKISSDSPRQLIDLVELFQLRSSAK